jgi:phage terminase small subunit
MSATPVYDSLNPQYQAFVDAYLSCYNATNAYIRAGYERDYAGQKGWRLLQRDDIQAALKERLEVIKAEVSHITPERIIREMADIALCDIENFLNIENGQVTLQDLKGISKASIVSAIQRKGKHGDTLELKFASKEKSLEMLARIFSMFNDKLDVNGDLAAAILSARRRVGENREEGADDAGSRHPILD